MTYRKSCLRALSLLLTLSIVLVSVNSPLTVKAQNSALSQNGNGDAEHKNEQSQSSNQNGQVISGHSSIASGNNLLCQNQDISNELTALDDICNLDEMNPPSIPPSSNEDTAILVLTTILRANCTFYNACPLFDGFIRVEGGFVFDFYAPQTRTTDGIATFYLRLPVGTDYSIAAMGMTDYGYEFELANIRGDCVGINECSSTMLSDGAKVEVNLHYKRLF